MQTGEFAGGCQSVWSFYIREPVPLLLGTLYLEQCQWWPGFVPLTRRVWLPTGRYARNVRFVGPQAWGRRQSVFTPSLVFNDSHIVNVRHRIQCLVEMAPIWYPLSVLGEHREQNIAAEVHEGRWSKKLTWFPIRGRSIPKNQITKMP